MERILKNAIRADSSLPANTGFSADDVRRIAGELGLDSSKLEFDRSESGPLVQHRFGVVDKVIFRAELAGDPELIFERAPSEIHRQYQLRPQISARPRGREMVSILPDTRIRLSVITEEGSVTLEYLRDFSTINFGPILVVCLILPVILGLSVVIADISLVVAFGLWLASSIGVLGLTRILSGRYLRQEEELWGRILAECRAD